jgi:rhodanese-related sulfurtransferase
MFYRMIMLATLGLFMVSTASAATQDFPGRAKYPDVRVIEKTDLLSKLNQVVIVDARSSLEFETLRITGAMNIPVAAKSFEAEVKALRKTTKRPIVFYCNGRTCMKSYHAVKKATAAGVKNLYAYDAGMFEWAKSYPEHAQLMGKSPVKQTDIISSDKFQRHLLYPEKFSNEANNLGARSLIIDVRDKYQRGATGLFPAVERWASLDDRQKLNHYIEEAKKTNKTLFIYDEVGKQVRWLQYSLEHANVENYFFMKKGARAYYDEMLKSFKIN